MKNLEPYSEPLFNVVRSKTTKDNPPEYLRGITLQQIAAYFFNWHPHKETALFTDIALWFKEARGWEWEAV